MEKENLNGNKPMDDFALKKKINRSKEKKMLSGTPSSTAWLKFLYKIF